MTGGWQTKRVPHNHTTTPASTQVGYPASSLRSDGRFVAQPVQQRLVQPLPDPFRLPIAQPAPAGGPAAAAEFLRGGALDILTRLPLGADRDGNA